MDRDRRQGSGISEPLSFAYLSPELAEERAFNSQLLNRPQTDP